MSIVDRSARIKNTAKCEQQRPPTVSLSTCSLWRHSNINYANFFAAREQHIQYSVGLNNQTTVFSYRKTKQTLQIILGSMLKHTGHKIFFSGPLSRGYKNV